MKPLYIIVALLMALPLSAQTVDTLTLQQKAAKMLIIGVKGTTLTPQNPVVEGVKEYGVSGVIFFEHNITPVGKGVDSKVVLKEFLDDIQALTPEKLFLAIDQEGGAVNRLKTKYGFPAMPSQKSVAQSSNPDYATEVSNTIAKAVASAGFNLNFAPCIDVDVNPACPVIGKRGRSFSADENEVAKLAEIYIKQHHKNNLLTSLKHFPGHGNSKVDSHLGLTDITTTWQVRELTPYKYLIQQNLCDMIMVSHLFNSNIDPVYPATLSKATIDGLLRKQLGWEGVVISDDMQMKAIVDHYGFEEAIITGINAGIDLFIVSDNISQPKVSTTKQFVKIVVNAVKEKKIDPKRIDESVQRIEKLRRKL